MSATLGPIHFWLYAKIGNQEQLTREIANAAVGSGWIDTAEPYVKTLPPLESVIDEGNIHGWLQDQITDAETRYAALVSLILSKHEKRLEQNGMPCDRVNAVTDTAADHLSWEMTRDIHAPYWNGNTSPYYAIRRSVMEGMLKDTGYQLLASDDFHYSIVTK